MQQRLMMQQQQQQLPLPPRVSSVGEAETVQNLCAVDASSIEFNAATAELSFITNTLVPCTLEVHSFVRVDVMLGSSVMITPNKPKPPPKAVHIPAAERSEHKVKIDDFNVSTEQERKYLSEYPKQIPVVLTLRYDVESGDDTNVTKGKGSSGSDKQCEHSLLQIAPECKVVMQLLEIKAQVFKVEHLFGGESTMIAQGSVVGDDIEGGKKDCNDDSDDEDKFCVICLTNEKDTAILPCMHLCVCGECAEQLRMKTHKCPVCRKPIDQLVKRKKAQQPVRGGSTSNEF